MNRASTVAYCDFKLQSFGEMQVDVSIRKKALKQVWAVTAANEMTGRYVGIVRMQVPSDGSLFTQ